eukprot:c19210_g1_i1 orf=350-3373(-)
MIGLELLPISTLLTLLTQEILETAFAAHDVLMEKETFRSLSLYLNSICPVLEELKTRDIKDVFTTKQALESLQHDLRKAKSLVDMCKKKSRFYQLVNCRSIVKNAQEITRDVGNSLALLSLANTEVSVNIRNNVEKLKDQMIHAEYQASQQRLEIVDKIEMGIKEHKTDQAFLNDLIRRIACAVGVPVEDSSEIRKELAYFRKEKEEASDRKEKVEEAYMEQIIALLSRADAAHTPEAIREDYRTMRCSVNVNKELPPFDTFCCPLSKEVMRDPVSVVIGQTYERERIENWFASGNNSDPVTKTVLPVLDLKPNHKIRECIEEWEDRNNCIRILNARKKLESREEALIQQALEELCALCIANYKIRHWIAEEQLVAHIVEMLKHMDNGINRYSLLALHTIISDSNDNKKQLVDAGGVELIVQCLARNTGISKLAVALLVELLQPGSLGLPGEASVVLEKLSKQGDAILLLVTLYNWEDVEAARNAEQILRQLCDKDRNIVEMAKANWFTPLVERLHHGSDTAKLTMAKALGDLELTQQSLETLGEQDAIQPLVEMLSRNLEYKALALRALQKLVSCPSNKRHLAEAGAVPLVIEHLYSVRFPINMRESAGAILEKLVLTDGNTWLVDAEGVPIDAGNTFLHTLLVLQDSLSNAPTVRKHVLSTLRGLVSSPLGSEAKRTFKDADGIAMLLPLLEHTDPEVRNASVQVLSCLASENAQEISHFIMQTNLVDRFVMLLNDERQGDIQVAAAGILGCLPQDEPGLTKKLVEENALPALMHLVTHGNLQAKENAIGALLRFTLPSDVELQKKVVDLGIYTALKGLICSGTQVSQIRAANALRNFSTSTMQLTLPPKIPGCCCLVRKASVVCRVHGGQCGEKTTFCLVEVDVVPDLVLLLKDRESDSAGAAVEALSTLVIENETLEKGAKLLHDEKAIDPILELISHGTEFSKERALNLLRKIFKVRRLAEQYAEKARILLVELATHGNDSMGKQATKILSSLEHFESSSFM